MNTNYSTGSTPGLNRRTTGEKRIAMEVLAEKNRKCPSEPEALFMKSPAFRHFGKPFMFQFLVQLNDEFLILDFYAEVPPFKIAIEIDGATHRKPGQQYNDRRRDILLAENFDIITFRIPARHVYEGMVNNAYLYRLMEPLWKKYELNKDRND